MAKETKYDVIVTIINRGFSDYVIESIAFKI